MTALLLVALAAADQRFPAIVNGSTTAEPAGVAALLIEDDGDLYGPFCSATLLASRWAVTAAHCVAAIQADYAQYDVFLATGANLFVAVDDLAEVVLAEAHPDYDATLYTDDIGLLMLGGQGLPGVEPVPIDPTAVGASWIDQDLRFVGFGITSDGAEDMGVKRYADIPLYTYDPELLYGYDPADGQNVCQGDSGGAALRLEGADPALAGVSSFVGLWKGQEGEDPCVDGFVGATRIDTKVDWIVETSQGEVEVGEGADTGDGTSPWGDKGGGLCAAARGGGLGALLLAIGAALARRRR